MHQNRRSRPFAAILLAFVLALAACGGDDSDGDAADDATTEATDAEERTTTTDDEETDATDDEETDTTDTDGADVEALIDQLLLGPEDLDPTFAEVGYEPNEEGGVCGISVDDEFPPSAQGGTTLESEQYGLAMVEEIRVYTDEDESIAAFQRAVDALSCGPNTVDPSITLSAIADRSADVGTDAFAVSVTGAELEGAIVVARVSDAIAVFQFQGAPGAAEAVGAPQPVEVAALGVDRILTTIEED